MDEQTTDSAVTPPDTEASPTPPSATEPTKRPTLEAPMDYAEHIRRLEAELARLRPAEPEPEEQVQTHTALLASGRTVPVFGAVPTHHYDDDLGETVPVVQAWPVRS